MVTITIIDRDNLPHCIDVPTDMSLNIMEVCKSCALPVEGTCGGMALCASCHLYVESHHLLPEPSEEEYYMLDQTLNFQENSRLGCQIRVTKDIQGVVLRLAPEV